MMHVGPITIAYFG